MSKQIVTAGQGVFPWGVDPRNRVLVDSTRSVVTSGQEIVAGAPICMNGATGNFAGMLKSTAGAGDLFYGLSSSNLNSLYGKVSLGEWTAVRANAELQGIYTVRNSVFLDANGDEVTVSPFEAAAWTGGADFPTTTDIGEILDAKLVVSQDADLAGTHLKWAPAGATGFGFPAVAVIVDVRGEEVDIMLPNKLQSYGSI